MDAMQQEPLEGIQMKADILPDGWWGGGNEARQETSSLLESCEISSRKKNRSLAMKRCCLEVIDSLKHCRFGIQKRVHLFFWGPKMGASGDSRGTRGLGGK